MDILRLVSKTCFCDPVSKLKSVAVNYSSSRHLRIFTMIRIYCSVKDVLGKDSCYVTYTA